MKENYWKPPLAFACGLAIALAFCLVKLPETQITSAPHLQIIILPYLFLYIIINRSPELKSYGPPFLVLATLMTLGSDIIDGERGWAIFQFIFVVLAITMMVNLDYKELSKNKKHAFWLPTVILAELALVQFSINGRGKIVIAISAITLPLIISAIEYAKQKFNRASLFAKNNEEDTTKNQNPTNHEKFSAS